MHKAIHKGQPATRKIKLKLKYGNETKTGGGKKATKTKTDWQN